MRAFPIRSASRCLTALLVALSLAGYGLPAGALAADGTSMSGKVYESADASAASSGTVYAVHLSTKQVYESGPIQADGSFTLAPLPYGYYDVVVVHESRVYLANRVLNIPAGEGMKVSFVLEEPDPNDAEWWSAAPDRKVPGLERTPDGVARIVEDDRALALLLREGSVPPAAAPPAAPVAAASQGPGFWETSSGWLIPAMVAAAIVGGGEILTEDNDDSEDEPSSPFE